MARKPAVLLKQLASRSTVDYRASILIVALWSLCLLSVFAVMLSYNVRQKIMLVKRLEERAKLSLIVDAGVHQAIALLQESEDKSYDSLNDPWGSSIDMFKDISVGEGVCNIKYEYTQDEMPQERWGLIDEESKININKVALSVLERLLHIGLKFDEVQAQELAASIVDWRDSDSNLTIPLGSAEAPYYRSLTYSYEAKDAYFEVLEELLLVKGVESETFEKIKDYITVYGEGKVNINTASGVVLLALGLSEDVVNKIILFRLGDDGILGTGDDNIFLSVSEIAPKIAQLCRLNEQQLAQVSVIVQENLTTKSSNFMVKCIANLNKRTNFTKVECIINRSGKIFYWNQL
jgi:type II secretory pathway component PulK